MTRLKRIFLHRKFCVWITIFQNVSNANTILIVTTKAMDNFVSSPVYRDLIVSRFQTDGTRIKPNISRIGFYSSCRRLPSQSSKVVALNVYLQMKIHIFFSTWLHFWDVTYTLHVSLLDILLFKYEYLRVVFFWKNPISKHLYRT